MVFVWCTEHLLTENRKIGLILHHQVIPELLPKLEIKKISNFEKNEHTEVAPLPNIYKTFTAQSPWYNHTGWLGVKHQVTYSSKMDIGPAPFSM